jgi:RimJ/RimL family protein N-acetyltransferase
VDRPTPSLGDVTTPRLDLRRFRESDLDELAAVFALDEVWRFPYGRGFSRTETAEFIERQIQHWHDRGFGCWVARLRATSDLIGYVGLSVPTFLPEILPAVEVGWRLSPEFWGHGYASEGARAALHEGFSTLGLETICSIPQADNLPSARVADRLGMTLVRSVTIPANEKRGELAGLLYELDRATWQATSSLPR